MYPDGFGDEIDINKNNKVDHIEDQLKNNQDEGAHDVDGKIRQDYMIKFRKEVDFHHKVAYRFEKAYRLGKK